MRVGSIRTLRGIVPSSEFGIASFKIDPIMISVPGGARTILKNEKDNKDREHNKQNDPRLHVYYRIAKIFFLTLFTAQALNLVFST